MAGEVPGHAVRQMLNSFAAVGIDVDQAIVGLGFRRVDLRNPFFRADSNDFVTVLERVAASTPRDVIEQAATHFGSSEPSARLVAQRIFITRLIYRAVLQGTAWMWPSMEIDLRALPDKGLEWHVRLKEGRPCPLYFELLALIVAALPRQIGLPNARVAAEVDERHGIYRIELPSSEELEDEDDGSPLPICGMASTRKHMSSSRLPDENQTRRERTAWWNSAYAPRGRSGR